MRPSPPIRIERSDDARVSGFRRLNDRAHRRAAEAPGPFSRGIFVAEGWLAVERLLASRSRTRSVLVADHRLQRWLDSDAWQRNGGRDRASLFVADQRVLDEIVGFPLHRGIVAVGERGLPPDPAVLIARARRLVVAEGVNDAENLGALCRNAAALGADGMLLDHTTCDPLTRRTVRVSVGQVLMLPWVRVTLPETLRRITADGWDTVALTPDPTAPDIGDLGSELRTATLDPAGGAHRRIALLVGAEGPGLSEAALESCRHRARIPMARGVDSLNVATAAAIACHELFTVP